MHLYRRADSPVWWVAFTLDGRRLRRSTRQTGKVAARLAAVGIIAEERQRRPVASAWRLDHLTGTWLAQHGAMRADRATVTYQLANLNRLLGGGTLVRDLTAADIIAYRAERKGEGVGNASVNRELALLRACIRWAAELHGQEPPAGLRSWRGLMLKEPEGRMRALEPGQYRALVDAADDELRTMILLAVTTGLRRDNIRGLTWGQVHLAEARIDVVQKGGRAHSVRLTHPVIAALARLPRGGAADCVFPAPNWRRRWERARARAGLPEGFRFHDLRHTFATWARHGGIDIADLKDAMGHSSIQTTMRYAKVLPIARRTAFDAATEALETFRISDTHATQGNAKR